MMVYLVKFVVVSGILFYFYNLVLRNHKLFKFNRFYLLAILIVALLVPVTVVKTEIVEIPIFSDTANTSEPSTSAIQNEFTNSSSVTDKQTPSLSTNDILLFLYLSIALLFFIKFFKNLRCIIKLKEKVDIVNIEGTGIVLRSDIPTSFSFFNHMFTNKERFEQGNLPIEVIEHEKVHIKQKHSLDIVFIELLQCIFWFNPFTYLIKKAIKLNHEFLADAHVISTFSSTYDYQKILLDYSSKHIPQSPAIVSNLNYGFTKKRFNMMTKNTSRFKSVMMQVAAFITIVSTFWMLGETKVVAQEVEVIVKAELSGSRAHFDFTTKENSNIETSVTRKPKLLLQDTLKPKVKEIEVVQKKKSPKVTILTIPKQDDLVRFNDKSGKLIEKKFKDLTKDEKRWYNNPKSNPEYFRVSPPMLKISQEEWNSFFDKKKYGVWLNDKKSSNDELEKYSPDDIHYFIESKLYGRAKEGRSYTHQLNVYTKSFVKETEKTGWQPYARPVIIEVKPQNNKKPQKPTLNEVPAKQQKSKNEPKQVMESNGKKPIKIQVVEIPVKGEKAKKKN